MNKIIKEKLITKAKKATDRFNKVKYQTFSFCMNIN